jgi:uncharacterized membrane-anchored protein
MKSLTSIACAFLFLAACTGRADDTPITTRQDAEALIATFNYQKGAIPLVGGIAKLQIPDTFRFLGPDDAHSVIVRLWHNPPGPNPLGMLLPADSSVLDPSSWAATVEYVEEGHVDDKDAEKIDYNTLLDQMKKDVAQSSKDRVAKGYPAISLVGWAAPPRYDAATHKLYWAKEIKFGNEQENTLNYNIRVLGRKGYLLLNIIAPMSRLDDIQKAAPEVLSMVDFTKGNQYNDYDSSTDKLATYGIAALVAGGIAAKAGLFKVILVGLLAAKKFILIGAAAVSGWFRKLFRKKDKAPAELPPQS